MYSGQTINDGSVVWKVKDLRDVATTSENGLMSSADKVKLNAIAEGANAYVLPTASSSTKGGVKVAGTQGLAMSGENITLAAASTNTLGGVKIVSNGGITNTSGAISLTAATASQIGGIKVGTGLTASSGTVTLAAASANTIGGVKIGSGISTGAGGIISIPSATSSNAGLMTAEQAAKLAGIDEGANNYTYTLPNAGTGTIGGVKVASAATGISLTSGAISLCAATTSSIGGVKIGAGLGVNAGTVSLAAASANTLGGVKISGNSSGIVNTSGTISLAAATSASIGGVKIGTGISTGAGGIISIASASDSANGLMTSDDHKILTAVNAEAFAVTPVSVKAASSVLFYNKKAQSPAIDFDQGKVSIVASGTTSVATNAGTYTIKAAPVNGYHWRGGTSTGAQNYVWTIQKAIPETFLSEQAVFLRPDNDKIRVEVESDSSGAVTLTLGSTTATLVSNAFFEAKVVTDGTVREIEFKYLTGPALSGSDADLISDTDLTVNVAADTNYDASTIKMRVHTSEVSGVLSHNSITDIKAVTVAGKAELFWSVGDIIGPVPMAGTISTGLELNDYEAYFYILGFDHNSAKESTGEDSEGASAGVYHTITFQFGKSGLARDSVSVAFVDDHYGQYNFSGDGYFRHHTTNTNAGGWAGYTDGTTTVAGSDLRKNNCVWFYNALPNDWQNAICPVVKYTDNHGGGTDTASYITASYEKVFLLSEFEVFGTRSYANSAEQNYQLRYTYFANGNSSVKYRFDDISVALAGSDRAWWGRSCSNPSTTGFFSPGDTHGNDHVENSYWDFGFAPAFCVGTMSGVLQSDIIALPS
jgi:hypothetical protein